mmetsp:Transcript_16250/g.26009  ORF Transcript_16250/g.26009 Transcript_16250/m.26009 type:complete len:82 (-) Transcript_16250:205-450(-)
MLKFKRKIFQIISCVNDLEDNDGFSKNNNNRPSIIRKILFLAENFMIDIVILKDGIFFTLLIKFKGIFNIKLDNRILFFSL